MAGLGEGQRSVCSLGYRKPDNSCTVLYCTVYNVLYNGLHHGLYSVQWTVQWTVQWPVQ